MKGYSALWLMVALCLIATPAIKAEENPYGYPHPDKYTLTIEQIEEKYKKQFDDPRPYLATDLALKNILPKVIYDEIAGDPEQLKKEWSELVGFKAPDVVGKIHPQIKPGKYTYQDVKSNPAFKELIYPELYNRIRPEEPGVIGNFTEFEIIPTRQYYQGKTIIRMTKENLGKTKLRSDGYLEWQTWQGGVPFPKPSGPQKAWQVMYNTEKKYQSFGGDQKLTGRVTGFNKDHRIDYDGTYYVNAVKFRGRGFLKPFGYFDERSEKKGEYKSFLLSFPKPRDTAGTTQNAIFNIDPQEADYVMVYIPSMRRIRKLTSTDSQDPVLGIDSTTDDHEGLMQKMNPDKYPYALKILEEREVLMIAPTVDGAEYTTPKGELKNTRLERRPVFVLELKQLDPSYVYSKRIMYVDQEMCDFRHIENYDRKERLYRVYDQYCAWHPDVGNWSWSGNFVLMLDYIDQHSTWEQPLSLPAAWSRSDVSLQQFMDLK
jgi:hypothetical protein